jgi:hypothetical protein
MSIHEDDGPPAMPLKRRRSFLAARHAEAGDSPIRTIEPFPTAAEEDDIPILTEVVTVEEDAAPLDGEAPATEEAPAAEDAPATSDSAALEELAARMVQAIDQQMAYELPTLIEATLHGAVADLRAGIASTVEAALRDFVVEQKRTSE